MDAETLAQVLATLRAHVRGEVRPIVALDRVPDGAPDDLVVVVAYQGGTRHVVRWAVVQRCVGCWTAATATDRKAATLAALRIAQRERT